MHDEYNDAVPRRSTLALGVMHPQSFAQQLSAPLCPIKELLLELADAKDIGSSIVARHNSKRASQYYAVELWPGLELAQIDQYERATSLCIPPPCKMVLNQISGATLGAVKIFGVPLSRLKSPPLLDRSRRQPLDLGIANSDWKYEYPGCYSLFHVGSIAWSGEDVAGVFLRESGEITAVLRNGAIVKTFDGYEAPFEYSVALLLEAQHAFERTRRE